MAKNDFDIDFDFEKEYGFDPKAILDSDYTDEDLDLSQFDDEALGLDLESESEFADFDLIHAWPPFTVSIQEFFPAVHTP